MGLKAQAKEWWIYTLLPNWELQMQCKSWYHLRTESTHKPLHFWRFSPWTPDYKPQCPKATPMQCCWKPSTWQQTRSKAIPLSPENHPPLAYGCRLGWRPEELQLHHQAYSRRVKDSVVKVSKYYASTSMYNSDPYLLHVFEWFLPCNILSNNLSFFEIDINSSVANSEDNIVQAHKESTKQEHAFWHDSNLARQHGNSVVVKFTLIEYHFLEESYWIWALQKLNRNLFATRYKWFAVDSTLIISRVWPIEWLHNFLDSLMCLLSGNL